MDNYSYHTSFESSQTDLGYANSNYLVHTSAAATINEDVSLSQLNMNSLTPKSWMNHQHIAQQSHKLPHHNRANGNLINQQQQQQIATPSNQAGDRKIITARRYLPFTSLAERNTQSVSTTILPDIFTTANHQIIRKRINFDNLTIIRQNSLNGEIRSKNFNVSSHLKISN